MAHVIKPIRRVLVANRGEIARRVFRTAHQMGISTAAVYADGDASAPFVRDADVAIALNGRTSAETYLDIDKVLAACESAEADAVHPGYGFLSENAEFAKAVIDRGITWVGPPIAAIEQMGDKLAAKEMMTRAEVPTLPSRHIGPDDDALAIAREIGFPAVIKASAGGGGRGMRVVDDEEQVLAAVEGARREALSSFGNDTVFMERWLAASRHVEIQILGDTHGNLVHLFERECSIQRRNQKVIEEAPSPAVTPEIRARMGTAALNAAREIGYASAGTVEFLLDGEEFWFLEVNTRLQVEHPVTEEITGLDLVREQLRIAEGEPLGYGQDDLAIKGHSIEARLYAEDPSRNFLPSPGRISVWDPSPDARFDVGIESGSEVSVNFDPMIAKVITHAPTRREAAAKLARALEGTRLQGITNNRDFLVAVLRTPEFIAGDTTTDFIARVAPTPARVPDERELRDAILAIAMLGQHQRHSSTRVLGFVPSGWRNSHMPPERSRYLHGDRELALEYRIGRDGRFRASIDGETVAVTVHGVEGDRIDFDVDGRRMARRVTSAGLKYQVHGPAGNVSVAEVERFPLPGAAQFEGELSAPMPGKVLAVEVTAGANVKAGDLLMILEAMKMEHRITAPVDGAVTAVNVVAGDQVDNGQTLAVIDDGSASKKE